MLLPLLCLLALIVNGDPKLDDSGAIEGVVVNGTKAGEPVAEAEVHLRAGVHGMLEPVDTVKTDVHGRFSFRDLPLDPAVVYLPGASHDGVHYPGQRVRLDINNRTANVKVVAFDAVSGISPLVIERHDIDIEVGERLLEITEHLVLVNSSRTTYIGQSRDDALATTLQLSIPPNFDRVTFDNEFHGRRFRIVDHRVLTDIPWPPGEVKLEFAYRVPIEETAGLFRRPLDLPSSNLRIRVGSYDPDNVPNIFCNLPTVSSAVGDHLVFVVADRQLPAGYTIELRVGNVPLPWMIYARGAALTSLAALVLFTIFLSRRRALTIRSPRSRWLARISKVH